MLFSETELEKKTLKEIGALIFGFEQKVDELANKIRRGEAKPADMLALTADLALLKKVRDKKASAQSKIVPRGQPKAAVELKSYEDYVSNKTKK